MAQKTINYGIMACIIAVVCTQEPLQPQWNNPVDPQGTNYSPPEILAIRDTSVATNDTLTLTITANDSPASVYKYLWSQDGKKFDTTTRASRSFVWFSNSMVNKSLWYKVINEHGLVSDVKKVTVSVLAFYPQLFQLRDTSVTINDTLSLTIQATDSLGTIKKYLWSKDGKKFDTSTSASRSFVWFSDSTVKKTLWYKVIDDDGLVSDVKILFVQVLAFPPKAEAASTASVGINDTLTITVAAADTLGTVEKYLWSQDSSHWDTTTNPSRSFVWVSDTTKKKTLWYKVIDDDGLVSPVKEVTVTVYVFSPQLVRLRDTSVTINDTLTLTIQATDSLGTITKYLWSTDGKKFDTSASASRSFVWFSTSTTEKTIWYKVIDDDVMVSDVKTCTVRVLAFPPQAEAPATATIVINDTLTITVSAVDSLGTVEKYLWSQDGSRWDTTSTPSRSFVLFSDIDTQKRVWYKVIDDDGLVSETKSVVINVRAIPPVIEAPKSIVVRWDQEATIQVAAVDSNGVVEQYIWKTSADPQWDTTDSPGWKVSYPQGGKIIITVGAIDNDGVKSFAETSVLFNRRPERITLDYPYNGKQHVFDEMDFTDTIGSVLAFGLTATDPDGADDSLRYAIEVIDTLSKESRFFNNVTSSIWIDSLFPGRWYRIVYKAYDRFGDSIASDVTFRTQDYFPKGMVYFPREPQYGIQHPFWIDTTEVTVEEYNKTLGTGYDSSIAQKPAVNINFDQYFLAKNGTSAKDVGYRIPSAGEWIRAYKNPDSASVYYWGSATHQDVVKQYAWYNLNAKAAEWTLPHAEKDGVQNVAQLLPNEYGLYDMSGNAAEWVRDHNRKTYSPSGSGISRGYYGGDAYQQATGLKPVGASSGNFRGFRRVYGQIYQ